MRVSMVDPSLFTGRYDDSLCDALAREGAHVELLARPKRPTDAIESKEYSYHSAFFSRSEPLRRVLGEGRAFRTLKAADYLAAASCGDLSRLRKSDAVHFQWLPLPLADRRLIARLKAGGNRPALVHTVHNASAFHGDRAGQAAGYRALLDQFDTLIVHGEETRAALVAQGLAEDCISIIPHPPMELARAEADTLAAVPDAHKPRILFFGTIRPYKGFDLLADACLSLWGEGLEFELAVAGKPFMDVENVIGSIKSAGYGSKLILDLGFLKEEQLDAHLRKCDIVAFPYRHIDSSGAFLSALHYGKAMVASRVGMFTGLREDAARLCEPESAPALADALRSLITDAGLRARLAAGALALRETMGQWRDAAQATLDVYRRAIKQVRKA